MSPQAAIESDVFRFYAVLVATLLVLAGVALAIMRARGRNVEHAWQSFRGWLIIIPVDLVAIFLGRIAAILFFTAVSIFAFKEYARATGLYRDWFMTGVAYLGIVAVGVFSALPDPSNGRTGCYGMFMALPVWVVALFLLIPIVRNRSQGQLQLLALAIVGFIYLGWMFGHLTFLTNSRHAYGYVLYLMFAVQLNDVAAFTFGKLFGRHPFRSNISPNKTWEGALGALAVSMALPWALQFTLPHFTVRDLLLTGVIVGVGGQLGDLAISVIKRDVGVKDMGAVLPGHGGILDRIDSLIYVAPLFFHFVRYFHDLY